MQNVESLIVQFMILHSIPTLIDTDGKTHVTAQAKAERLSNHFESQYQHIGDTDLPNISQSPHPCIPKLTIGFEAVLASDKSQQRLWP